MKSSRKRKKEVVVASAKKTVLANSVQGGEEFLKQETIEIVPFETEPAYVRVGAGVTKNLGNYESLRIDVSLSVPTYVEQIEETQKNVAIQVSKMLDREIAEYLGDDDG